MNTVLDTKQGTPNQKNWLSSGLVVAIALLVRVGILIAEPDGLSRDTDSYRAIAETLRSTGIFGYQSTANQVVPTAFRPPLYPLLLSPLVAGATLSPVTVGGFNLVCGLVTVVVVWLLGTEWGLGSRAAAVAAGLTACDPILVNQSAQLMTETLATLMSVVVLWGITRCAVRPTAKSGILAGVVLGLAALCRPTFLPWSGLVGLALWLLGSTGEHRGRWSWKSIVPAGALVAGVAFTILPWGVRNYLQFGQWKFTTTHGGYTLLLGNNPAYYRFLRDGGTRRTWDSDELRQAWIARARIRDAQDDLFAKPELGSDQAAIDSPETRVSRTEFEDDALAYAFAVRFIREDPSTFFRACLQRARSFWRVVPLQVSPSESTGQRIVRWCAGIWYAALFAAAIFGAYRLRFRVFHSPWIWGILLCLAFTAVHSVYWSDMRMRAPVMPFVALLAASGMSGVAERRTGGRWTWGRFPTCPNRK